MFIVQTNDDLITETRGGWKAAPNGLLGVHLVHPAINVSVGLLGYDKYREGRPYLAYMPAAEWRDRESEVG
jgi:hypothetical protein